MRLGFPFPSNSIFVTDPASFLSLMGSLPVPSHSSASDLDLVDPRYNLSRLSGSVIDARGMVLDRYAVSG